MIERNEKTKKKITHMLCLRENTQGSLYTLAQTGGGCETERQWELAFSKLLFSHSCFVCQPPLSPPDTVMENALK
jgi:hypothetical protein